MIEVEKKFILSNEDKNNLIKGGQFTATKIYTDILYDTADYSLTTKDIWLRSRNGQFELKLPLDKTEILFDQYEEIEDENKIKQFLNLNTDQNLKEGLEQKGYQPFCVCKTTREKYQNGPFKIDLDSVEYEDFTYGLAEIELMVENESEMKPAQEKIDNFAKSLGLKVTNRIRGKVVEYLKRKRPEHYQSLINAGVVKKD